MLSLLLADVAIAKLGAAIGCYWRRYGYWSYW